MASGEDIKQLTGPNKSASSSSNSSRNDCDEAHWMQPNNWEIASHSKPTKKQRNKEKSYLQEAIAANAPEGFSTNLSFQNYTRAKCNTASWLKDEKCRKKPRDIEVNSASSADKIEKKTRESENNTASWLMDVPDERIRKKTRDSEEVLSDSEVPHGGMNLPVCHTVEVPEHSDELQRPPSRSIDNENIKAIKDVCKKNEEIRDEFNKIKEAMKQVTQGEREHKYLLQHLASEGGFVSNGVSSSTSKASNYKPNVASRDSIEGSTYFSDEERSNKCNHLMDKMKQSEERLMCLKQQESLLYQMQKKKKKVESKLASFQEPPELNDQESARIPQDQILPSPEDLAHSSSSWYFDTKDIGEQRQWADKSFQGPSGDKESPSFKVKDMQDIKQLHMSLEHIKKQVQLMQQSTDIKNITRSPSPDNSEFDERVARVEFERKKLKNKLLELQEKKKVNARLLQELSYLREHTVDAVKVENEVNFTPRRNSQQVQLKGKQKAESNKVVPNSNYLKLQTTLQYLESLMKSMGSEENIQNSSLIEESARAAASMDLRSETNLIDPAAKYQELTTSLKYLEDIMSLDSPENSSNEAIVNESSKIPAPRLELRNIRSGSTMKRDNVRNDINSGFPARRHYEAEGRANEDADQPTAPINPSLMIKKSRGNTASEMENLRKLQEVQKRILLFNDLIASIREHNETGKPISLDHQRLIASLDRESNNEPTASLGRESTNEPIASLGRGSNNEIWVDDTSSSDDGEEFEIIPTVPERKQSENSTTVKEICSEGANSSLHPPDIQEEINASPPVPYNMELPSLEKDYASLQNEVNRLVLLEEEKELVSNKKKDFSTLKHQINQLIQRTIDGRNEDTVRSSGEGGYVINQNADSLPTTSDHRQPTPPAQIGHQDNLLLTRQNIATMESQNQRCSRNLHNRSCGSKKDNINNLSGKMGKLSIQNAVNNPFSQGLDTPKDNLDSVSMLSSDLNRRHSGETERKTILDILKRNRKKQKIYDVNQDNHIFSNSSIDSETLESSQAANTTAGATWGGSSTHEIFQEENDEAPRLLETQRGAGIRSTREDACRPAPRASKSSRRMPIRGDTSGSTNELPRSPRQIDSIIDFQRQTSIFIIQLQKYIDQLNQVCQEKLNEVLESAIRLQSNNSPNLHHTARNVQAVPENIQPHNQQLLLCLSQCYHTLYLQQLEIQHLHRCLRHNIDSEVLHQANNLNPQGNNDEFVFRPCCLPAANPFTPTDMYSNPQVSPKSSPANYVPFSFNACPPLNATTAGIHPVRAVIHPVNHGNAGAHETLNNQVPPHTRANNFLDNLRSYSRPNMLSTSNNIKRNENIGLPVAPQIRQVHPMVSNEGLLPGPHPRTYSSPLENDFNRSFINPERQLPPPCFQGVINCSKKPNANLSTSAHSRYQDMHKKRVFTNSDSSDLRNIRFEQCCGQEDEPAPIPLTNSSINLVQLYPIQDESKIGNFPTVSPASVAETSVKTSDASGHARGEFDYNSDFLHSLYQEAKSLKSHLKRQQALDMIRDLAISENDDNEPGTHNKNNLPISSGEIIPRGGDTDPAIEIFPEDLRINTTGTTDFEKSANRLSESSIPWTNQNLPTAAISPLSKQPTSTGAVRKKPKFQSSSFRSYSTSNTQASTSNTQASTSNTNESGNTREDVPSLQPIIESTHDFAENTVVNILLDLQQALPFAQMREESSMSFWCSVNAFIINRIRAHMNVPLPHKSLALLRHQLDQIVPRYVGKRICECGPKFLKRISQFLFESIDCFMETGRFSYSSSSASFSDSSSNLKCSAVPENLSVTIPLETDNAQDLSINTTSDDVFSPQGQPVLQQNIALSASVAENDVNANNPFRDIFMSEADVGSEWGPEAEPEVEAGTEADLAEADQSPGQGNLTNTSLSSTEPGATVNNCGPVVNEEEVSGGVNEASEDVCDNLPPGECADSQETAFDDVPTKLCSTEDEPQKLEEEPIHLTSSGDSQNNELLSESNSCESEVTSTK